MHSKRRGNKLEITKQNNTKDKQANKKTRHRQAQQGYIKTGVYRLGTVCRPATGGALI